MDKKTAKTEDNRTINLQFRVNEEEMKLIEEWQAQVEILNRSAYLRPSMQRKQMQPGAFTWKTSIP